MLTQIKGLDHKLNLFHLHGETIKLTEDMKLLATGKFCHNQIAKVGHKLLQNFLDIARL